MSEETRIIAYYTPPTESNMFGRFRLTKPTTEESEPMTLFLPEGYQSVSIEKSPPNSPNKPAILCPGGIVVTAFQPCGWSKKPVISYFPEPWGAVKRRNNRRVECDVLNPHSVQRVMAYRYEHMKTGEVLWTLNPLTVSECVPTPIYLPQDVKMYRDGPDGAPYFERPIPAAEVNRLKPNQSRAMRADRLGLDPTNASTAPCIIMGKMDGQAGLTCQPCRLAHPDDLWPEAMEETTSQHADSMGNVIVTERLVNGPQKTTIYERTYQKVDTPTGI